MRLPFIYLFIIKYFSVSWSEETLNKEFSCLAGHVLAADLTCFCYRRFLLKNIITFAVNRYSARRIPKLYIHTRTVFTSFLGGKASCAFFHDEKNFRQKWLSQNLTFYLVGKNIMVYVSKSYFQTL